MSAQPAQPAPQAVREATQRLLSSPELARSEQLKRFLAFIVEETLAGRADGIKEYTVGVSVLGRDATFDPGTDPVVRIQGGRLRRALERYYLVEGIDDPVRIEVPKGGYRPTFHATETASAAPEAGARGAETPAEDPTRVLDRGPTIAVMPFTNLSGDVDQDYFAAGLTEELIVKLARLQELVVITHQSVRRYLNSAVDTRRAGADLGARFLLEGSIRKDANNIRATVQLTETSAGRCLWAQTYDRELALGNLFEIQDDITRNVAAMIGDAYGLIPRTLSKETLGKPVGEVGVYEATLRFYYFRAVAGREAHAAARRALEQAVELDPEYAPGWAMLGEIYLAAYLHGFPVAKRPLEKARSCARRAIAIDPMCQNARWSMAFVHFMNRDKERFLREAEAVIDLNPNSAYMMGLVGVGMALAGEWERSLGMLTRVMHLNPYNPGWFHVPHCLDHYRHGRYEEALAAAEKLNIPQSLWDPVLRAAILGQLGRRKEARGAIEEILSVKPTFRRNARRYLNRVIYPNDLVDHLIEGLSRAGLA